MPLADQDAWLRLALTPGLSTRRRLQVLELAGAPDALREPDVLARIAGLLGESLTGKLHECITGPSWPLLEQTLSWLQMPGRSLLTLADPGYPRALLDLPDPPVLLYCHGDPSLLLRRGLAVVGSRNPTPQGADNARMFAAELALHGLVIVSGMASGIDAAAHRGALEVSGATIGIVGTGLDRVYPAANHALAQAIAEQGLLLSEFPLGMPPRAENFPQRNRLIAAQGAGCLVVEAALGSGSLITARQAADVGREVYAIPGSIHSPLAKGCHWLIRQGAKLVDDVNDVLDELPGTMMPVLDGVLTPSPRAPDDGGVLAAVGWDPVDLDTLVLRTGLTHGELCEILLGLELQGAVLLLPGARYQRAGNPK
ncbi:DNA-protecting protein DprA [Chitinilyticum litopenaei]|uniref:DNA-protecting protein DprA n=1 Tax=Chitinilyticum piscinae TaxID=2866724 RepID=A0A8J7KGR2_9NEIS|nr:DNA-protecting protein DprA [Chitinilyticum piscinae]